MSSETRRRLLDSAATLLAQRGYMETSLEDIAREAGLTKGAVFSSFTGKQDLLLRLIDKWQEDSRRHLESGRSVPFHSIAEFALGLGGHETWSGVVPEFWRQAVDDEDVRSHLEASYEAIRCHIASLVTGWRTDVDASAVASTAAGLHDGLIVLESIGDPRVAAISVAEVVRLLRSGEAARQARERAAS